MLKARLDVQQARLCFSYSFANLESFNKLKHSEKCGLGHNRSSIEHLNLANSRLGSMDDIEILED